MPLLILIASILALSLYGAGILPGTSYFLAVVLAGAYGWTAWRQRTAARQLGRLAFLPLIAAIILVAMAVTALPLPRVFEDAAGFRRQAQSQRAAEAVAAAVEIGIVSEAPAPSLALSRNRAGTWRTLLLVLCAFCAAGLTARLGEEQREFLLEFLVYFMTVFAVMGFLTQWVVPQGRALWWFYPMDEGQPVGPFINRNHFAGFVALVCPVALGRSLDALGSYRLGLAFRRLACFLLMSIAVFSSLSRGAFLAYLCGMGVLMLLHMRQHHQTSVRVVLGLVLLIIVTGVALMPSETVSRRLQTLLHLTETDSAIVRATSWRDSLQLMRDYPLVGVGAEGFRSVFSIYTSNPTRRVFYYAENEYVQLLTDHGLLGGGLFLLLVAGIGWKIYQGRSLSGYDRGTWVGLVAGGSVAGAHAVVDFAPRILLYMLLLAILVGLLLPAPEQQEEREEVAPGTDTFNAWFAPLGALAALVAVAGMVAIQGMDIYRLDSHVFLKECRAPELVKGVLYAPTQSQVWYLLGREGFVLGTQDGLRFAEQCLSEAARYAPSDHRLWNDLARLRLVLHDSLGATDAIERAVQLEPMALRNYE